MESKDTAYNKINWDKPGDLQELTKAAFALYQMIPTKDHYELSTEATIIRESWRDKHGNQHEVLITLNHKCIPKESWDRIMSV